MEKNYTGYLYVKHSGQGAGSMRVAKTASPPKPGEIRVKLTLAIDIPAEVQHELKIQVSVPRPTVVEAQDVYEAFAPLVAEEG